MPRTLSPALTTLLATNRAPSVLLLDLVAGAQAWYAATHRVTFNGHDYEPYLRFTQPLTRTRGLKLDRVTVEVQNANLWFTQQQAQFELRGAAATLRKLYPDVGEAIVIFDGRLAAPYTAYVTGRLEIVQALDPGKQTVPRFKYSGLCVLRFKSPECGYDPGGAGDTCAKTIVACQGYGQVHRFRAFPTITRELEDTVPPPPPPPSTGTEFNLETTIYEC